VITRRACADENIESRRSRRQPLGVEMRIPSCNAPSGSQFEILGDWNRHRESLQD
jgi:hypothetical protein